jgi:hypothetical protein
MATNAGVATRLKTSIDDEYLLRVLIPKGRCDGRFRWTPAVTNVARASRLGRLVREIFVPGPSPDDDGPRPHFDPNRRPHCLLFIAIPLARRLW